MKTHLHTIKKLCFAFFLFFMTSWSANATTYYARADGNWNSNTTWSLSPNNGPAVAIGDYPKVGDDVYIGWHHTVTITADAACSNFLGSDLGGGIGTPGILTFAVGAITFTVSGNIQLGGQGAADTNMTRNNVLILQSGSIINCSGSTTIGNSGINASAGTLDMTAGGTFNTGSLAVGTGSHTFISGSGTVTLTATNSLPSDAIFASFNNLTVSSGTTTLTQAIAIGGELTIASGASADLSTFTNTTNTLKLGGVGTVMGLWGSTSGTSVPVANQNNTYFALTTGNVNVTNSTNPPTAVSQILCPGATVANLVATGTALKWYDVATLGSALVNSEVLTSKTYYVSQTLNSIESTRTMVAVTVNPVIAQISVPDNQVYCPSTAIATGMLNFSAQVQYFDFDNGPQGWTSGLFSGITNTWSINSFGFSGNSFGTPNNGSLSLEHSYIISPVLSVDANVSVSFKSYTNNESLPWDIEFVELSLDGGATWTSLDNNDATLHLSSDTQWRSFTFIGNNAASSNAMLRFRYNTVDGCCGGNSSFPIGWYIDNVEIGTSANTTFTWTNNNTNIGLGASGAGSSLPTFSTANTTNAPIVATITVTPQYTNSSGGPTCNGTPKNFTITVNPTLTASVSIAASATQVCPITSVLFTATPTNGGTNPTYQWYNGAAAITGATSSTYTYTAVGNVNAISVKMTSNATPCLAGSPATSNSISITYFPTLTASVSVTPSASTVCAGTAVTFTATTNNGGTTPVYQWYNGATTVGTNSPTYTYTPTAGNTDAITVKMTSNATPCLAGSPATSSPAITIVVNPILTASVSVTPSATTVCSGTSVTYTATPTNGGTAPVYQWYNGATAVGTNSASYSYIPTVGNTDAITVKMTSNATPCLAGSPATSSAVPAVTVSPALVTPTATLSAGILSSSAATGNQWWNCTTNTAIAGATNQTYTPALAGSYKVVVTAGACSATSSCVTVTNPLVVNGFDSKAFSFYPNPVKNELNLSYTKEITKVSVVNVLGQIMSSKSVNAKTATIDMSSLPTGVYLVELKSNDESKTIKVVKK